MTGWEKTRVASYAPANKTWLGDAAKGAMHIDMQMVAREHEDNNAHLQLLIDPQLVRVKKEFPKSSLRLVGCSPKVVVKMGAGAGIACSATAPAGDRVQMWASPHFVSPLLPNGDTADNAFVCPFWFVQKVAGNDDESPVNMALS